MKANKARSDQDLIAHWRRVGPKLERIRRQELRNFDFKAHWQTIDGLLQLACAQGKPRTTSGLVEYQRILAKARR